MNTKLTYHKIQINPELLEHGNADYQGTFDKLKIGSVIDTLPAGQLKGLYFISYVKELDAWSAIDYKGDNPEPVNVRDKAFICSHTEIRIEDTRNHFITQPTDIKDYERKNWNAKGYKETPFEFKSNEQITIKYVTQGDAYPPCGEFIFVIDEEISC